MDDLRSEELLIRVDRSVPGCVRLDWLGRCNAANPGEVISPFFAQVLTEANEGGCMVDMHLEALESFNSAAIATLIRIINAAQNARVALRIHYAKLRWQAISLEALGRAVGLLGSGEGPKAQLVPARLTESSAEAASRPEYDVFLCHSSGDKPQVRELARLLRERNVRVFFDEDDLVPGRPWLEGLETAIEKSRAALILYGSSQIGPWAGREMRAFLAEFVRRDASIIPVLLPGAPEAVPELPIFLREFQWVDLREATADGFERLLVGIRSAQGHTPATPPEGIYPPLVPGLPAGAKPSRWSRAPGWLWGVMTASATLLLALLYWVARK